MASSKNFPFSGKLKITGLNILSSQQVKPKNYLITCHLSKQIVRHVPNKFIPKRVKFANNFVWLSEFVAESAGGQLVEQENKQYGIYIAAQNHTTCFFNFFFKTYSCVLYNKPNCSIVLTQKASSVESLLFQQVDRPKFAKTQKLSNLLLGHDNQDTGIVSMDQAGRFLVQSLDCTFPAVGIWVRCIDLDEIRVYMRIFNFLWKKAHKNFTKFMLGFEKKNCIVFVKINEKQAPRLYLVSWKQANQPQQQIVSSYELKEDKQIVLEFNKQHLEFTLRGQHNAQKDAQELCTYNSPTKNNANQQFEQQLQRIHLQQSPQFSSIKKHHWMEERAVLLQKVESQYSEIRRLKKQVERLTSQLQNIKNTSQKPLAYFKSPSILGSGSAGHEKLKKLSSSDLQLSASNKKLNVKILESGSTKEKNSMGSGSISNSGQVTKEENWNVSPCGTKQNEYEGVEKTRAGNGTHLNKNKSCNQNKYLQFQQDPWDMMEIIQ